MNIHLSSVQKQFPQLQRTINGNRLIYLDSAATSFKPQSVIDSVSHYYTNLCVNVHRAIHPLAEEATLAYEATRDKVAHHLNINDRSEVIFTRGTTEAINLVATILEAEINQGDDIVITISEHHSNLVPWQILAKKKNANLKYIELKADGTLDLEQAKTVITHKCKILAFPFISNVLGIINPIQKLLDFAKTHGAYTLVDAAQAMGRIPIDLKKYSPDFLVFSSHKCFGPTSFGILYGKKEILEKLPPYMGGGDMIEYVGLQETTYNQLPYKYEAGTPNIAAAIGFGSALDFINTIGIKNIYEHELKLTRYLYEKLNTINSLKIIGTSENKLGLVCFTIEGLHPQDIATLLGKKGIALRSGHLCAQPLLRSLGVESLLRASISIYNTEDDIDQLIQQLHNVIKLLRD